MKNPQEKRISLSIVPATGTTRLEKIGIRRFELNDPYHLALTLSWPQFFVGLLLVYLVVNVGFGLLYYLQPGSIANARPGSMFDAFFFSVETLATVGYGAMVPVSAYGHVISAIEIFTGMVLTAMMTGLVFVRFSRPKARLLYARKAVVARRDEVPTLMIRIGNGRANALMDAQARVIVLVAETDAQGHTFRRAHDLKLVRSEFPFFPLTWTLMHALTPDSPLVGLQGDAPLDGLRLYLSISARDPSLGAMVYDSMTYGAEDIARRMRYADAVSWDGLNRSVADMRKLSDIEPDGAAPPTER